MVNSWNLPKSLCKLVRDHHDLEFLTSNATEMEKLQYAIYVVAENIVCQSKTTTYTPDWLKLKEDVFDMLGLDDELYDDLVQDIEQMA